MLPNPLTPVMQAFASYLSMLEYKRPARSKHEQKFINRYLGPWNMNVDAYGNHYHIINNPDGSKPRVLWSSHVDTVHHMSGKQSLEIWDSNGATYIGTSGIDCLGADCTTGVWLMLELMKAGKAGLYIFHRDEEIGALGSVWIAKNTPELLDGIDFAIAFDRKGVNNIITKQMGQTCCSDVFASSLSGQLCKGNTALPIFYADPTGAYTDTYSYIDIIPECTNISVGYYDQHSNKEVQNLDHMVYLLAALINLDIDALVKHRDPHAYKLTPKLTPNWFKASRVYENDPWDNDNDNDFLRDYEGYGEPVDEADMVELVTYSPSQAAKLLIRLGATIQDLLDIS